MTPIGIGFDEKRGCWIDQGILRFERIGYGSCSGSKEGKFFALCDGGLGKIAKQKDDMIKTEKSDCCITIQPNWGSSAANSPQTAIFRKTHQSACMR